MSYLPGGLNSGLCLGEHNACMVEKYAARRCQLDAP